MVVKIKIVDQVEDLSLLLDIAVVSFQDDIAHDLESANNQTSIKELYIGKARYLINLLQRPKFIIAENNNGLIVGFATISNFTLNHLYSFSWLCVEPSCRNQGIGQLIVKAAGEYAKQQQSGLVLTTAIPTFFQPIGFEISNEFKPGWFLMATKVDL